MAASPLITFKAGRCTKEGKKITPDPTPGYIYLYSEDELVHFCWRARSQPASDPEIDLIAMGDATFAPLVKAPGADDVRSPTNGRIFVLRFSSSGEKNYFWMQARSQHRGGDADWFSARDQRLGQIVDSLLSGEDVDVEREVEEMRQGGGGEGDGGANGNGEEEDLMDLDRSETGGAGQDATGGDPREEGEASREGGADGGRAPQDTSSLVQNFLNSLGGAAGGSSSTASGARGADKPSYTLTDLLTTTTTIPYIASLSASESNTLCTLLPTDLFLLAQESSSTSSSSDPEPTPAAAQAAIEALSLDQKKEILARVFRSPQLHQSLGSLTVALRDGGLPMIGEALGLKVRNGGLLKKGGSMPMGGGEAVEAFVEGCKTKVEEEETDGGGE